MDHAGICSRTSRKLHLSLRLSYLLCIAACWMTGYVLADEAEIQHWLSLCACKADLTLTTADGEVAIPELAAGYDSQTPDAEHKSLSFPTKHELKENALADMALHMRFEVLRLKDHGHLIQTYGRLNMDIDDLMADRQVLIAATFAATIEPVAGGSFCSDFRTPASMAIESISSDISDLEISTSSSLAATIPQIAVISVQAFSQHPPLKLDSEASPQATPSQHFIIASTTPLGLTSSAALAYSALRQMDLPHNIDLAKGGFPAAEQRRAALPALSLTPLLPNKLIISSDVTSKAHTSGQKFPILVLEEVELPVESQRINAAQDFGQHTLPKLDSAASPQAACPQQLIIASTTSVALQSPPELANSPLSADLPHSINLSEGGFPAARYLAVTHLEHAPPTVRSLALVLPNPLTCSSEMISCRAETFGPTFLVYVLDEAEQSLKNQRINFPSDHQLQLYLHLLSQCSSQEEVIAVARKLTEIYVELKGNTGQTYETLLDEAMKYLNSDYLLLAMIQAAYKAGHRRSALKMAEEYQIQDAEPDVTKALRLIIAVAHFSEGNQEAARRKMLSWLDDYQQETDADQVRFLLGWSYMVAGDELRALIWFKQVLELHPESRFAPQAGNFISRIER